MRIKPNFGTKEPTPSRDNDDPWGCIRIPLVTVVSYFVLKAIVNYTSGTGSKLDQMICYGALIVFLVIMLLGVIEWIKDGVVIDREKQLWRDSGATTEVPIVNRDGFPGGSYEDEYGIPHRVRAHYRFRLRLPNQIEVNVDVSERIYKKLENSDTVRIYYKPESPWTFMLEDEI